MKNEATSFVGVLARGFAKQAKQEEERLVRVPFRLNERNLSISLREETSRERLSE